MRIRIIVLMFFGLLLWAYIIALGLLGLSGMLPDNPILRLLLGAVIVVWILALSYFGKRAKLG